MKRKVSFIFALVLILSLMYFVPSSVDASTEVIFKDSNLEAVVREELGIPKDKITQEDMLGLEELGASFYGITDLTGLEYATNLVELDLRWNNISDISPLSNLTNLQYLSLAKNNITDISPLEKLINLQDLDLSGNNITDISPLEKLTNLQYLDLDGNNIILDGNNIIDISPLEKLANLEELCLGYNNISDISPLASLTNLQVLRLYDNNITDISPLKKLTNLEDLDLDVNNISDISPLEKLTNLKDLNVGGNNISDISPLANLTNLQGLWLWGCNVSDISPLEKLTNLQGLSLVYNNITDISVLREMTNLVDVYLSSNYLDLTPASDTMKLIDELKAEKIHIGYSPQKDYGINLNQTLIKMRAGEKTQIKGIVYPIGSDQSITWTSSDSSIATVNKDGLITAIKNGTVYIEATAADGETTAFAEVKVTDKVTFKDLKTDHWAYKQIQHLAKKNIVKGNSDGYFMPGDNITRAQAAVMIVNALGLDLEVGTTKFSDVPSDHWASGHIAAAQKAGIINGYKDGTFKPGENITRAQIAVMIVNAYDLNQSGEGVSFSDVQSGTNGHWAYKHINILASNGIINGYGDGTFKPGELATRAHFSVFLSNTINLKP